MAKQSINTLKNWFKKGLKPLEVQFADWLDSFHHKDATDIPMTAIVDLLDTLNDLAPSTAITDLRDELRGGVPVPGDTLNKLYNLISAITITLDAVLTAGNSANGKRITNLLDPVAAQDADTKAARDAAIATLSTQLIDGATDNTLKKLQDKITAINSIIGGSSPDGDSIVNTVAELLSVFSTYTEGVDIVTLVSGKVNVSDVYNALDMLVAGKVLDARQGKELKDLIDLKAPLVSPALSGTPTAPTAAPGTNTTQLATTAFVAAAAAAVTAPDASETVKGIAELLTQAESETVATAGTSAGADHTRVVSGRGLWWFFDKIKTLSATITNTWTFTGIKISGQIAASGKRNLTTVDDTGTLTKHAWVEVDETNKKISKSGKDTLSSVLEEWKNSGGDNILKLHNDLSAEFGGTIFEIRVADAIASGNSSVVVNADQDEALAIKDKSSNKYLTIKSTTTGDGRALVITKTWIEDVGLGFKVVHKQYFIATDTTAAAHTVIGSIPLATSQSLEILVEHALAHATNGNVQSLVPVRCIAKNTAGTVTASHESLTALQLGPSSGGFNFNVNGTSLEFRFQNETGTGRAYTITASLSYILRDIPV